jgi:hypothetical protein
MASISKSTTTDRSQATAEGSQAIQQGSKSAFASAGASQQNIGKGANLGAQFGDIGGNLILGDSGAVVDVAKAFSNTLGAALQGQRDITRDAIGNVSDLASGGDQSTKKTLLWLALAGVVAYFIFKKA